MKKFLRLAAALFLRFLIVVALATVATNVLSEAGTAGEQQARIVAAAVLIVSAAMYYASVKVAGRPFRAVRDSVIVLLILALSWVFVANMFAVTSRSRARRTMADILSLSNAVEAYATDNNSYPQAKSLDELAKLLEPTYVKQMPRQDAWRFPLRYEVIGTGKQSQYYIGSSASGGEWEKPHLSDYQKRVNKSSTEDIILHNGTFVASPMGQSAP